MQVEKRDVIEAIRLLEVALQQSATDHSTGKCTTNFKFIFSNVRFSMDFVLHCLMICFYARFSLVDDIRNTVAICVLEAEPCLTD